MAGRNSVTRVTSAIPLAPIVNVNERPDVNENTFQDTQIPVRDHRTRRRGDRNMIDNGFVILNIGDFAEHRRPPRWHRPCHWTLR